MQFQIDEPRGHGRLMCLHLVWWQIYALLSSQTINLIISRWKRNKGFLPSVDSPPSPRHPSHHKYLTSCVVILQLPSDPQLISCGAFFSCFFFFLRERVAVVNALTLECSASFFFFFTFCFASCLPGFSEVLLMAE